MRVVVTRAAGDEVELVARLEEAGHQVVHVPLIAIEPLGDEPVDVGGYEWLLVTSARGATELRRRGLVGSPPRVAAIGPATARALGGADLVARVSTQEGLLAELPRPPGRVLLAAAEGARRLIADELGADVLALYRTHELRPATFPDADVCVLASASAARAFGALARPIPSVCIGPQTALAAEAAGVEVAAVAATHDVAGLVEAVERLAGS